MRALLERTSLRKLRTTGPSLAGFQTRARPACTVLGVRSAKTTPGGAEVADSGGDERYAFAGFDEGEDAGPGGGSVDDVRGEAGGGAEGEHGVVEGGGLRALAHDKALAGEGGDGNGRGGERVIAREDDDDGVVE